MVISTHFKQYEQVFESGDESGNESGDESGDESGAEWYAVLVLGDICKFTKFVGDILRFLTSYD